MSEYEGRMYPRVQILSAQDLLEGKQVQMPGSRTAVFAQAARERQREGVQGRLGYVGGGGAATGKVSDEEVVARMAALKVAR